MISRPIYRPIHRSIYRGIAASIGGGITPADLFKNGADGFWLDPADFNSLWVDEAKTTHPTLPGDVVWWLGDKSGNANHFGAVSSAARGRLYRWPVSAVLAGYPRNRLIATDTMATQSVTVLAEQMTVSFKGTGTVTLSGASTAGPLVGTGAEDIVSLTFTPTAGSLTLTVAGSVTEAQLEPGAARSTYQAVGAGLWDVTEEGQPDCWGIAGDGISTQYLSSRGIPLFVDGKMRAAAGVTNPSLTQSSNAIVLSNQESSNYENGYRTYIQQSDNSFRILCRRDSSNTIATTGSQLPPVSALLDYRIDAPGGEVSAQMNNNAPASSTGPAGSIASSNFSLYAFGGGSNYFNGIIWGTILVAEEPDTGTWEISARQWLSNHNMGGILND